MSTIVREIMTAKVVVRSGNGSRRMSKIEAILLRMAEKAFAGNVPAIQALLKLYAHNVSDGPLVAARLDVPTDDVPVADMDAHDHAILSVFRHKILQGGEP